MVLPAPDGPTKAMVSPRRTEKVTCSSAGPDAVRWEKLTDSNPRSRSGSTTTGCSGRFSAAMDRMAWYCARLASVSRKMAITSPTCWRGPKMKNE